MSTCKKETVVLFYITKSDAFCSTFTSVRDPQAIPPCKILSRSSSVVGKNADVGSMALLIFIS